MANLNEMGQAARESSYDLATRTASEKNEALLVMADELEAQSDAVLSANELDVADAREQGLSEALIDRLLLTSRRIA
ncbi:MAG: gamma-glutamyl-phosphate reductase, partial [Candidatus Promineifilaceae bacterium]